MSMNHSFGGTRAMEASVRRAIILVTVFLMLQGPVHAAEFGAKPTVYIDNLQSYQDHIFYVYLSGGNLDLDSVPFGMRWSRIELVLCQT